MTRAMIRALRGDFSRQLSDASACLDAEPFDQEAARRALRRVISALWVVDARLAESEDDSEPVDGVNRSGW